MAVMKVCQFLADLCERAKKLGDDDYLDEARDFVKQYGPSGSGIDCGTRLVKGNDNRLVLEFDFHHMDSNGVYDGWTHHTVHVTPSLRYSYEMRITGRDRDNIKEYCYDLYSAFLEADYTDFTKGHWYNYVTKQYGA